MKEQKNFPMMVMALQQALEMVEKENVSERSHLKNEILLCLSEGMDQVGKVEEAFKLSS